MPKNIDNDKKYEINVNFLLRDDAVYYDIYVQLGSKVIKYLDKNFNNKDALIKLKSKNIENVYLTRDGYLDYLNKRKNEQLYILTEKDRDQDDLLKSLVSNQELIREIFKDFGLNSEQFTVVQKLNKKNVLYLKNTKSLEDLFNLFSKIPETSILKKQMETFFCVQMIDLFPEFKNGNYAEKVSLAIMLSDVFLTEEEYWESFQKPKQLLSEKIINHPTLLAQRLGEGSLPTNIICMINQHHEKPDGTGYPLGIDCSTINIFAAFYIIAEDFVTQLLRVKMKSNETQNCIDYMNLKYNKYLNTSFEKALNAFNKIINNDKFYLGTTNVQNGGKHVA
jgi:hypothetical protein